MPLTTPRRSRALGLIAAAALSLTLAACSSTAATDSLVVGTTDVLVNLDPAVSSDSGSRLIQSQLFGYLLSRTPGSQKLVPDLAATAEFSGPESFTVVLRPNLRFANGDRLTSSDVVFSFERLRSIAAPGSAELLSSLAKVTASGAQSVVFHLARADPAFPSMLASSVGAIVDEQVFSTSATSNEKIVSAEAFDGQYAVDSFHPGRLITLTRNDRYAGGLDSAKSDIALKYYSNAEDLRIDVESGIVDVAVQGVAASDLSELRERSSLSVIAGPGPEMRYLAFNSATMPFAADPDRSRGIRQAVADLIDRSKLAARVEQGRFAPLYAFIPRGVPDAVPVLRDAYGTGNGAPDPDKAAAILQSVGVDTPVELDIEYSPELFGSSSSAEYTELKSQLESSGLFRVILTKEPGASYDSDRLAGAYAEYQFGSTLGVVDAGRSLQESFGAKGIPLPTSQSAISDAIDTQSVDMNGVTRSAQLAAIQSELAIELPILPLLQSQQFIVVHKDITGVHADAIAPLRFASLAKR